jgi:hypothetical protein
LEQRVYLQRGLFCGAGDVNVVLKRWKKRWKATTFLRGMFCYYEEIKAEERFHKLPKTVLLVHPIKDQHLDSAIPEIVLLITRQGVKEGVVLQFGNGML